MHENKEDQINAIKYLFPKNSKNGKVLAVSAILGAGMLMSWCFWSNQELKKIRAASESYRITVDAIRADQPQTLRIAEKFTANNKNIYGVLAALKVAQLYVHKNELDKAIVQLHRGLAATGDVNLKSLINIRLARIQVEQKKADEALKTLDTIKGEGFSAIIADLRGEALLRKGDKQGARSAWESAVKSNDSPEVIEIVKVKINNL